MNIKQLKYFVAVAEKLNFTEAAKDLYIAQSAVSQQIAELEKKLGIPLFNRNRRSVELTKAGEVLYQQAIDLLKKFDEAQEITMNAHLGYKGHLKIGYIGYGDRTWLTKILKFFKEEYPAITLDVNRYNQGELTKALKENALDMVITFSFGIQDQSRTTQTKLKIETHHIYTESLRVVMALDNPLINIWGTDSIKLDALTDESFIVQNRHESPQGFDKTMQICNAYGFSPQIVNTPNLVQTVLLLVEANLGIALLPASIQEYAGPNLAFIPLEISPDLGDYDIVAAWKTSNSNPSLKYLIDSITKL